MSLLDVLLLVSDYIKFINDFITKVVLQYDLINSILLSTELL